MSALSGIAFVACILALGWCLYVAESPDVDGQWAKVERQAAQQANPDDYVEELLTLVRKR